MSVMNPVIASCSFESCSDSMVGRVIGALVDQLCAYIDIDIALLDALEHPLDECLVVLRPFGVVQATVSASTEVIVVELRLAQHICGGSAILADDDVITSFFDVTVADSADAVTLIGSLR